MNWQHLDSMGGEIISLAELMIAGNGSNCQQRIPEEKIGYQKKNGTRGLWISRPRGFSGPRGGFRKIPRMKIYRPFFL